MGREFAKPRPITLHGRRIFLRAPKKADYREFAKLMKANAPVYRGLVPPFKVESSLQNTSTVAAARIF